MGWNGADLSFIIIIYLFRKTKTCNFINVLSIKNCKIPNAAWFNYFGVHFDEFGYVPFLSIFHLTFPKGIQSEAIRSVCFIKTLIRWRFCLKIRFYNPKDFSPAKKWFLFSGCKLLEKLLFSFDRKLFPLCWKERWFCCQVTQRIQDISSANANNVYLRVLELFLSLFEVFKGVSESFNVCVFASWEGCSGRYEDKHKLNSTAKSQSLKVPGFEYEVWWVWRQTFTTTPVTGLKVQSLKVLGKEAFTSGKIFTHQS